MVQQLTDMSITRVSLVDKGANQRRIAVLKREAEGQMTQTGAAAADETGLVAVLRKWFAGQSSPVGKATTFAAIVAGQELSDALYDSWYTLQDALWSAIYAVDDSGADLTLEAKRALVAQNLDEFKAYLLNEMAEGTTLEGVGKRAGGLAGSPSRHVAAIVAKVGRKISGSRLERLQSAAEALTSVLDEVVEDSSADTATDEEDTEVDKAEITKTITEALAAGLEPITKRLDAIEAGKVEKAEGDDAPATLETIAEAVGKLADRIEGLEKVATVGKRTSVAGQDGGEVKKASQFAGLF